MGRLVYLKLGSIDRKLTFVLLSRFWPLRGWGEGEGGGGLSKSVKKRKFATKIFCSELLNP